MIQLIGHLIDRPVIVRSTPAGVFAGILVGAEGNTFRLSQVTHCRGQWATTGTGSVAELAEDGPNSHSFPKPTAERYVSYVSDVLPISETAWAKFPK